MKNKKLLIHIGMPKTGSSAIQAFLFLNRDRLARAGYAYPWQTGFEQAFQTASGNAAQLHEMIVDRRNNEFKRQIEAISSPNIIISSENLFHTSRLFPDRFASFFHDYDFQVICYIRRIDDLLESCVNQLIKNHDLVDYSDYEHILSDHNYASTLMGLADHIPESQIIVRRYDKASFIGGDIYSDFCDAAGLPMPDTDVEYPNKNVNPSLNWEAAEFRRMLNHIGVDTQKNALKYNINGILAHYSVNSGGSSRPILGRQIRQDIRNTFATDEANLAARFFESGQPIFPTQDSSQAESVPPEILSTQKLANILQYIYEANRNCFFTIVDHVALASIDKVSLSIRSCLAAEIFPNIVASEGEQIISMPELRSRILAILPPVKIILADNFASALFERSEDISEILFDPDGGFRVTSQGTDPYFSLPPIATEAQSLFYLVIEIKPPCETILQVFFQTKEEAFFHHDRSISRTLRPGWNSIHVLLADGDFNGRLRIDPGIHAGDYKINSISIFSNALPARQN